MLWGECPGTPSSGAVWCVGEPREWEHDSHTLAHGSLLWAGICMGPFLPFSLSLLPHPPLLSLLHLSSLFSLLPLLPALPTFTLFPLLLPLPPLLSAPCGDLPHAYGCRLEGCGQGWRHSPSLCLHEGSLTWHARQDTRVPHDLLLCDTQEHPEHPWRHTHHGGHKVQRRDVGLKLLYLTVRSSSICPGVSL